MRSSTIRYQFLALLCMLGAGHATGCGKLAAECNGTGAAIIRSSSQGEPEESIPSTGPQPDSVVSQDCSWRKCEISEGPLACLFDSIACDMYRNQCVPVCRGDNCCDGVKCPEGTVCVPFLGRCGIPAGEGCYDLGTDWWSGRDIPPDKSPAPSEATPVTFELYNDSQADLYIEATLEHPIRFDLYVSYCNRLRKLELAINHFCPTICPAQGRPVEIDCGPPPPIMYCLPAGERLIIPWSGMEQVGNWRVCGSTRASYCMVDRVTLPGTYTVEICTYPGVDGGRADSKDTNRLVGAVPVGARKCCRVVFEHPATTPVAVHLGRDTL